MQAAPEWNDRPSMTSLPVSYVQTESTRILTHILHSYAWILIYNLHKLPWILICSYPTQVRYLLSLIRGILFVGYCYILISASSDIKIHIRVASFQWTENQFFVDDRNAKLKKVTFKTLNWKNRKNLTGSTFQQKHFFATLFL